MTISRVSVDAQTGERIEVPLTAEEIAEIDVLAMQSLRVQRNKLLAESDWTQLLDAPAQNKAAWAAYRQALRDLPANTANPRAPVWPQKPE